MTTYPLTEAYSGEEPYIFVSYAHKDNEIVYPEIQLLQKKGFRIWYDEGIDPGNEWPDEIAKALSRCALFIVFISAHSVQSQNVRNEINFALSRKKPFFAIHLEEIRLPDSMELQMGSFQAILKWRMPEDRYLRQLEKALPSDLCISDSVPGNKIVGNDGFRDEITPHQFQVLWYSPNVFEKDSVIIQSSLDSQWIAAASSDRSRMVTLNLLNGELIHDFKGGSGPLDLSGRFFATHTGKIIKVGDMSTGEWVHIFEGHEDNVTSAIISKDGLKIISTDGNDSGTLKIWDIPTNECIFSNEVYVGSYVRCCELFKNDQFITGSGSFYDDTFNPWNNSVRIWDMSGGLVAKLESHATNVNCIAISNDNCYIASGSQRVILWDYQRDKEILLDKYSDIDKILISKDNKFLLAASWRKALFIWDIENKEAAQIYEPKHELSVSGLCGLIGGNYFITFHEHKITTWDIQSGENKFFYVNHDDLIIDCKVVGNDKIICGHASGSVSLLKVESLSNLL